VDSSEKEKLGAELKTCYQGFKNEEEKERAFDKESFYKVCFVLNKSPLAAD